MKKLITGIAIMMAMTIGAQAQDNTKPKDQGGKQRMEERYKTLDLTDAQKGQLKTINADFKTKMDNLKKDESITVKDMKEKRMAIAKERRTAFENVLTPEQKTKFDELKNDRKEKGANHKKRAAR